MPYPGIARIKLVDSRESVAESEWGSKDDVHDDFEKLLLARADVRVMVFDGRRYGTGTTDRFEEFAKYIGKCDRTETGDTYLLAAWMPDKFEYCRIGAFQAHRMLG